MKKFRRIMIILAGIIFSLVFFSGCGGDEKTITIYVPDGGTILPLAHIWNEQTQIQSGYKLEFEKIAGDMVDGKLQTESADIIIAPINLAAKAYNEGHSYVVGAVMVWGNSYILSRGEAPSDLQSLFGQTVVAFQEAGIPGVTLKAVLNMNSIPYKVINSDDSELDSNKINLMFLASPAAVVEKMNDSSINFALLPEPNATIKSNAGANSWNIAFDIQQLWDTEQENVSYPQACLLVKGSFLDSNKEFVDKLLQEVKKSADYTLANAQYAADFAASDKVQSAALSNSAMIKNYIEGSGQKILKYTSAKDAKAQIEAYLTVLKELAPMTIGSSLPPSSFYYNG